MKTKKTSSATILLSFLLFFCLWSFGVATARAASENKVTSGEFFVEPSTLISLGFEWYIEGDDNRNATVEVSYRKEGNKAWERGLPLFRIHRERTSGWVNYTAPNLFAGSILDLEPDTMYECRFVMSDPDGINGQAEQLVKVRTRAEPKPFPGGRIFHVYPAESPTIPEGAFGGLMAAYYQGAVGGDWTNAWPARVQPGDTILVHAGLYKDQRFKYGHELLFSGGKACCTTTWDGTYYLTQSGTSERPIVIKAAGDGEVIFDGDGNYNLFNVMAANYNYFEGITVRNTDIAFLAGNKSIAGSSGLTVKKCRFENIGVGVFTDYSGSKNFYIADNVFIGRDDSTHLMGWYGPPWTPFPDYPRPNKSYFAMKLYGSGHVMCHNFIANFHDGIDHATYGLPDGYPNMLRDKMPVSIDIYNNDITNISDNCIEADGAMHNIRILRNRCLNQAANSLSMQTVFGGPAYWIRNIVYHAPQGSFKPSVQPSGGVFYHNTMIANVSGLGARGISSNMHFRNNLILGEMPGEEIFGMETFTNYTSSDYNGFRPSEGVESSFIWNSPPFNIFADYSQPREQRKFKTLTEYSQATGQDKHSILVDYDIFRNVAKADSKDPRRLYKSDELDFQLRSNAAAVDAGSILPNINDGFIGKAPDLGALEAGQPPPVYGPRP
jgi:hypothetical protein